MQVEVNKTDELIKKAEKWLIDETSGNCQNLSRKQAAKAMAYFHQHLFQQLSQQPISTTLRLKLLEMLNEVTDVMTNDNVHPMSLEKLSGEKRVLQKVLKLIDESTYVLIA